MSYMALYRKFRPQTFGQVKGQDHVVRTLKNQIKNGRIGHAYLFTGTRGTGKTSVAKLFARAVNCLEPADGEPCNCCENCRAALKESFLDIREVDAASNTSVDDIRSIIEEIRYTPVKGKYKVYIIDEVHMLSSSAFNAFLKTLEEPPEYAVFILATTEPHKLPVTILSRCQRYDFHRIASDVIAENLGRIAAEEGIDAQKEALEYIARAGDGSMRDAVSLLDKCITFNLGERLTYENVLKSLGAVDIDIFSGLFNAVCSGNAAAAITQIENAVNDGRDISRLVNDFLWYVRNLLLIKVDPGTGAEVFGVSGEDMDILKKDSASVQAPVLMRYIRVLSELLGNLRTSAAKQILTETAFIKLAKPEMESDNASLAARIRQLEARVEELSAGRGPAKAPEEVPVVSVPQTGAEENIQTEPETFFEPYPEPCPEDAAAGFAWDAGPGPAAVQQEAGAAAEKTQGAAAEAVFSWNDIIAACTVPRLRVALRKVKPAAEAGNILVLQVDEEMQQQKEYLEGQKTQIELLINSILHDSVNVIVRSGTADERVPANGFEPETEFPEELLKNINFDIGTEEE